MINIATFNLFNYLEPPYACYEFDRIYSEEQWHKKTMWIKNYISQYQPDVIGFQEVFSPTALQSLLLTKGYTHFAVVDKPHVQSDYIFSRPVVAIASKYPIKEIADVEAVLHEEECIGLKNDFVFSRRPLRATIEFPYIGDVDCYVVHFKSKRPTIEIEEVLETDAAIINAFRQTTLGQWGSSLQRGSEAAYLFQAMIKRKYETTLPMILMGDFNDKLTSESLSHLQISNLRFNSNKHTESLIAQVALKDSWDIYKHTVENSTARPATHYYGNVGSVLDYILLSCEFDSAYSQSALEVSQYQTYDQHLINPIYAQDSESTDHAIVQITLSPRI